MRHAPTRFVERLKTMFDDRLRIRWSNQRGEWHIEYKVGRGRPASFFVSGYDDAAIRAKDGYAFLLAIRTGDRMPCPRCGHDMPVPVRKLAESTCEYCRMQGRDGRYPAAFFDLDGESLFEYLRRIDPYRGWRHNLHRMADATNDRILKAKEREFANKIEAITMDNYNQLVGIPSVGYTGKVMPGTEIGGKSV